MKRRAWLGAALALVGERVGEAVVLQLERADGTRYDVTLTAVAPPP